MTFARLDSGKKGELLAEAFLKSKGYKIIARNYRTRLGELDIIGEDKGCVVFIEVRSVNSFRFGSPLCTVNRKKQSRIAKASLAYIKKYGLQYKDCRFDVISIEGVDSPDPKIDLIRDAFELDAQYRY